jgi:hypothetical protein
MTPATLTRPATSTEDRLERRGRKDLSRVHTVVTASNGRVCAEKLNVLAVTGKALGWVVEFLVSSNRLVRPVAPRPEPAKRIAALWEDVDAMRFTPADWNGYGSEAPNQFAREIAQQFLLSAHTLRVVPDRVAPSAQGGVGICFYNGNKYGDIECLNSGEILATLTDGVGRPRVWEVKPSDARGALEEIVQFITA